MLKESLRLQDYCLEQRLYHTLFGDEAQGADTLLDTAKLLSTYMAARLPNAKRSRLGLIWQNVTATAKCNRNSPLSSKLERSASTWQKNASV